MPDTPPIGVTGAAYSGLGGATPAASSLNYSGAGPSASPPSWEHHLKVGRQCLAQGDVAGAEREYRAAVAESEAAGADSPQFASALSNFGQLRYQQKKFADAAELFRRALEVREKLVGAEHFSLVQSINNLAAAEVALSDLGAAEPLLHRALLLTERHYGADHPDVATCLSNLSRLYFRRGAYAMAEPFLQRLLGIKQAQGEDHPEVASVLANLATVRQMIGQYDSAEELWRHVLSIRERSLASNAPALATTLENLADTCAACGKVDEALGLRERALDIHEQTLGADHPTVVSARAKIVGLQLESSLDGLDATRGDMFIPVGPSTPRPSPWVPLVRPSGDQGPRMFGEVDPRAHVAEAPPVVVPPAAPLAAPPSAPPRATVASQPQITAEALSALLSEVEAEQQHAPRSPLAAGAMVMRDFARSMLGGKRRSAPELPSAAVAAEPTAPAAAPVTQSSAQSSPAVEAPRRDLPIMLPEPKTQLAIRESGALTAEADAEWSDDGEGLTHADVALVSGRSRKMTAVGVGVAMVSVALVLTVVNLGRSRPAATVPPSTTEQLGSGAPALPAAVAVDSLVAQSRALAAAADSARNAAAQSAASDDRSEGHRVTAASRERSERSRSDSSNANLSVPKAMSAMETIKTAVDLIHVSYQIDSSSHARMDTALNPATKLPVSFKSKPIVPRP